jgi:putative endonuclease
MQDCDYKSTRDRRQAERRGHFAERTAGWWLQLCGFRILARHWRCAAGEIDLIVKRRRQLVFVEVKYRFHAEQIVMPSSTQYCRIRSTATLFLPNTQKCLMRNAGLIR